nr:hypothetical protein [Tanacetum cinerariifolium]
NVGGNGGNRFGQYAGQVAQNQQGFNAWQNGRIQFDQNAGVQRGGNQNGLVVVPEIANQSETSNVFATRAEGTGIGNQAMCYNCRGLGHIARNYTARPRRMDSAYLQTQLLIAQKEEAGIQLQAKEFDFMAAAGDLDEIREVNANCILMPNLQQASTSSTQHDRAPVYDTDGSAEVHLNDNFYDNEIFNMFTQEEHMVHSGGTVETSSAPNEEIRAHQETVYRNLVEQVTQADESLDKQKYLELKIKRLLKASVSLDIMSIVQNGLVDVPSDLRTKLDRTKEKLELCIIKREKEYAVLWNNCASNTLDSLNQKLESKIVELEFQVVNYERKINHLKTTYMNLFDSIKSNRAHAKLHDLIFENAKLRAWLFENTSESVKNNSGTSVTPHVDKPKLSAATPRSKKLHALTQSHCNPAQRIQCRLVHTARTRRPQPKGNTRNAKVLSASKSSEVKKIVTVEDHRRTLLLSKNQKTMSSECNNIKLAIQNDKSKIVCDTYKQCLVTVNHDTCLTPFVNVLNPRANKLYVNVPLSANQKRHRIQVWKPT